MRVQCDILVLRENVKLLRLALRRNNHHLRWVRLIETACVGEAHERQMRFQRWTGRREEAKSAALERVGERLWQWWYVIASEQLICERLSLRIHSEPPLRAQPAVKSLGLRPEEGGEHD